ncbi:ATP-binding protein [Paenalcaligenes hominis]|uniref:ATP-binding protein n=1 Tax=Paenalcaligenes hominis TaxID=643674 RepID=A0A1U9K126_9BURK|nr:YncE family protein [Paenalcaligenes hominis]AQS51750.1 ATP-binding protein [Paenalcaligenes hominis]
MQINLSIKNKSWQRLGLGLSALALSAAAWANPIFDQPDPNFMGTLGVSGVVYPGQQAEVWGRGFTPGQEVQLIRSGNVLSGTKPLVADDKGEIRAQLTIPADAAIGLHPIVAQVAKPSAATVFDLKVSPVVPAKGTELYVLDQAPVTNGLYQVAYSAKNNVLYVTSSVGRPPVKQSQLSQLDPTTLKTLNAVTPAADTEREGQVMAVYGVAVDDEANTVWVTNTRADTVSVYDQKDLNLVKQFPHGSAVHARDVVVDGTHQRAFASSPTSNQLYVFDTKTLKALEPITLNSKTHQDFSSMSLSLDPKNHKLYTVSLRTNELAVIDTKTLRVEKVIALPGIKGAAGVSVAADKNRVFVTGQGSDSVGIVDINKGELIQVVQVGAGSLNVLWDDATQAAYVANRGSDTLSVLDSDGNLIANLEVGSFPNHIATDHNGHVFFVNKARGQNDDSADFITRLQLK